MKEFEFLNKSENLSTKSALYISRPPTMEQLRTMTTNELVRMLMRPDMAKPANVSLRQQIIKILQEREGNSFVQRLLGKSSGKTTT